MKIIILLEKYGGFCNRLFQSLHYHAYAIKEGATFFNPTMLGLLKFDNYFFYFLDRVNNLLLKFLVRLIQCLFKNNEICFYFNENNYIKIVKGWEFRKDQLTFKYHKNLNNLYTFKSKHLLNKSRSLINYLNDLKKNGKFIVGVHIRKKDYKLWNNGKYYFSDNFYIEVINKLKAKLIKDNYDPFILTLSDEIISSELGFDYSSNDSWKIDQIILQNCDLIMGPPSTFTMWASYIAKVPLIKLYSQKSYDLNSGSICRG